MSGLDDVGGVDVVVVRHICVVVILQSHHEGDESVHWNLERLEQVAFLTQMSDVSFFIKNDSPWKN